MDQQEHLHSEIEELRTLEAKRAVLEAQLEHRRRTLEQNTLQASLEPQIVAKKLDLVALREVDLIRIRIYGPVYGFLYTDPYTDSYIRIRI